MRNSNAPLLGGQGMVFVGDDPAARNFPQADGEAEFEGLRFPGRIRPGADTGSGGEGDFFAGGDFHVAQVERCRLSGPGEKGLPGLHVGVDAARLKRRRHIEHQNRGSVICADGGPVGVAHSLRPITNEGADLSGIARGGLRFLSSRWHGQEPPSAENRLEERGAALVAQAGREVDEPDVYGNRHRRSNDAERRKALFPDGKAFAEGEQRNDSDGHDGEHGGGPAVFAVAVDGREREGDRAEQEYRRGCNGERFHEERYLKVLYFVLRRRGSLRHENA
jgi:hypothetical protein